MARLIDTHAHLDFSQFKDDLEQVLERARQAGVGPIVNVGTGEYSSRQVVSLSSRYPQLWAAVGIHPHYAAQVSPSYLEDLTRLAERPRVIAIGETGLDYYRNLSPPDAQERLFRGHLRLACEVDKPVIIHSRDAHAETLKIIKEEALPSRKGVMHCFSGDRKFAHAFLELGLFLSLAGPVTYPRSHELRSLLKEIPRDRLLMETDAPYLPPQAFRSLRNEPAFVKAVYERVALALEVDLEQLARQVQENAAALFTGIINIEDDTYIS
jgi:TatD DNase family protein